MLRYLLTSCLLVMFVSACAPASADLDQVQSTDSAAASETAHAEEDEHGAEDADEHGVEGREHHDEATEEQGHEDEDEHREHSAHEHGVAELTVAWSGEEMAIDLQTPAYNVVGFEDVPTTDAEKVLLAESVAALEAGDLLQPNPEAECLLVSAHVHTGLSEEAHVDEEDEEDEDGHDTDSHSDIDVSYNLTCGQPDMIATLDASALFAHFSNFENIQVQWVSDTQQSATTLTPDNPVLSFE